MSLKQIHVFLKRAIFIVFSMIVVACATGLSFNAHYCHGSLSGIAFYAEIGIQKPVSCGCNEDLSVSKAKATQSVPISINKNSCCSNIAFFSKLNFETLTNTSAFNALIQPVLNSSIVTNSLQLVSSAENISFSDFKFRPPPLAGRVLVLFLSQLRIPLIIYNN